MFARHIYYVNILLGFNRKTSDKRIGLFKFGRNSRNVNDHFFIQIRKKTMAVN